MDVEKLRLAHDSAEGVEEAQHGIRGKDAMGRRLPSLLLAVICGSMAAGASEPTTTQRDYDKDLLSRGVRFVPPVGWRKTRESAQPKLLVGVTFTLVDQGAIVSSDGHKFPEAIMSVVVNWISKDEWERGLSTVQEKKEQVNLAGVPGYSWFVEGEPAAVKVKGIKVKRKLHSLFKDNKMYVIFYSSYSSALAEKENFETYLPIFEQAVSTFELVSTADKPYDRDLLKHGVRFVPPSGWLKSGRMEAPLYKVTFYLLLPRYPIVKIHAGVKEASEKEFEREISAVPEKTQVNLAEVPGYSWLYETEPQEEPVGRKAKSREKWKAYMLFKDNKIYLFMYGTTAENFETHLPAFEQAISTFELVE